MNKLFSTLSLCALMTLPLSATSDINNTSLVKPTSSIPLGLGDKIFPNEGNLGIDVQNYDLNITWDDKSGNIKPQPPYKCVVQKT